jgi:hypothetical protein
MRTIPRTRNSHPRHKCIINIRLIEILDEIPCFLTPQRSLIYSQGSDLPNEAKVKTAASSLNKKRRSWGDLSSVSQIYEVHFFSGFSLMMLNSDASSLPDSITCSVAEGDFSSAMAMVGKRLSENDCEKLSRFAT